MNGRRVAALAAGLLAIVVIAIAVQFGSTVAGGSDSYGYVSQAGLWRGGQLTVDQDLAARVPWPLAIETLAPLGYRPAPGRPNAVVPIYPAGLPLLMALFQLVGGYCAAFLVVPGCGALTVWLTYALGRRLSASAASHLRRRCSWRRAPSFSIN